MISKIPSASSDYHSIQIIGKSRISSYSPPGKNISRTTQRSRGQNSIIIRVRYLSNAVIGTIHLRRRHFLGGEGVKNWPNLPTDSSKKLSRVGGQGSTIVKICRRLKWMVPQCFMYLPHYDQPADKLDCLIKCQKIVI